MRRLGTVVVVMVAAVAAGSSSAAPKHIVHGVVGPGAAISLKDGLGNPYTSGRAGMYVVSVRDRSTRDGFRLVGPGVNMVVTGVSFVGGRTVSLTLGPGTYTYRSDAHPRTLRGTFVLKR